MGCLEELTRNISVSTKSYGIIIHKMPAVLFKFLENFVLVTIGIRRLLRMSEILAFRLRIRGQPFLNATYILAPGEILIVPH